MEIETGRPVVTPIRVWRVDALSMERIRDRLCEILIDSVEHGASVGFLSPLDTADADAFWRKVECAVRDERCILLVAALADGEIAGTVQMDIDTLPNQPHRAEVHKLLVHSSARRRGVGEALMTAVERMALEAGRWLLILDTATTDAAKLYERLGWKLAGVIPNYALNPDRTLTDTTFFWKQLVDDP